VPQDGSACPHTVKLIRGCSKVGIQLHELSIASQIWDSVKKAASARRARRVQSIKLEIGALQMIEEDQLTFWLQTLAEREGSPGVEVEITTLPEGTQVRVVSAEIEPGDGREQP